MTSDGPVTFELDGPDATERRLASVAAARHEVDRLRARAAEVEQELEALEAEAGAALAEVEAEEEDVRRLERFTLTGLLADLRGRKEAELEREFAEVVAARYRVATLRDRQVAVVRELDVLQDRLVALGDLDAEWAEAMADHERWATSQADAARPRLAELAVALGEVEDEQRECEEARSAAVDALARLDEVRDALGNPADWPESAPSVDERLDALCQHARSAEDALRVLAGELGDLDEGLGVVAAGAVDRWDRAFDALLAGLTEHPSMRRQVADAVDLVDLAQEKVGRIAARVEERAEALAAQVAALAAERAELVAAPTAQM